MQILICNDYQSSSVREHKAIYKRCVSGQTIQSTLLDMLKNVSKSSIDWKAKNAFTAR